MKSRPFILYGASDNTKVLDYTRTAVQAWVESWVAYAIPEGTLEAKLLDVAVAPDQNWRYLESDSEHQFGLRMEGDWAGGLPEMLYGSVCAGLRRDQLGVLEQELLDSILADLAARVLKKPVSTVHRLESLISAPLRAEAKQPGAGFMLVRISVTASHHLWLLMSPQLVDTIDGVIDHRASRTSLVSPNQAIGSRMVTLHMAVGSGEVTIEELSSLAVGDVIPLDRKLNDEIDVCLNNDTPICRGYMGVKQGKIAVQLLSNS